MSMIIDNDFKKEKTIIWNFYEKRFSIEPFEAMVCETNSETQPVSSRGSWWELHFRESAIMSQAVLID